MSQVETHIGKFRIVTNNTKETVEFIKENLSDIYEVVEQNGKTKIDLTEKGDQMMFEFACEHKAFDYDLLSIDGEYILVNFLEHKYFSEDDDITDLKKNPDGTYNFLAQFYNGGGCFSEVLEHMIKHKRQ